ncbi:hypothetical protein VUR80DRAFT_9895 [Thermomyces stellatus]
MGTRKKTGVSRVCSRQIVILSACDAETKIGGPLSSDSDPVLPFSPPRTSPGPPNGHICPSHYVKSGVCQCHLLRFVHAKAYGSLDAPPGGSPSFIVLYSLLSPASAASTTDPPTPVLSDRPFPDGASTLPPKERIHQGKSCVLTLCYSHTTCCQLYKSTTKSPPAPFSHWPASQQPESCSDLQNLDA